MKHKREQKSMSENITLYSELFLSGALCLVAIQNSVIDNPDFTFLDLVYDLLIVNLFPSLHIEEILST